MKKLDKILTNYLSESYFWNGEPVITKEKLKQMFEKADYIPNEKLLDFLIYFYNNTFKFKTNGKIIDVDFRIKKVLKDFPHECFYLQTKKLLNAENITPFGEIDKGHMTLISDEADNIYAVMDDYVITFGDDYFELLNRIYKNGYE